MALLTPSELQIPPQCLLGSEPFLTEPSHHSSKAKAVRDVRIPGHMRINAPSSVRTELLGGEALAAPRLRNVDSGTKRRSSITTSRETAAASARRTRAPAAFSGSGKGGVSIKVRRRGRSRRENHATAFFPYRRLGALLRRAGRRGLSLAQLAPPGVLPAASVPIPRVGGPRRLSNHPPWKTVTL